MNNNITDISSFAENQNNKPDYKQMASQDIKTIENLVRSGAMTQEQGLNLMNYVTQKAFEMYNRSDAPENKTSVLPDTVPEFFNIDGRVDVFDYLKKCNVDFDEDEIAAISSLVEKIEKTAVDRYLREQEKIVNSENEDAKLRLRANAQNAVSDGLNNVVYTREQIGKMNGAEFAKHERAIMDQLRKGLIK